jgi:hypothetical protein
MVLLAELMVMVLQERLVVVVVVVFTLPVFGMEVIMHQVVPDLSRAVRVEPGLLAVISSSPEDLEEVLLQMDIIHVIHLGEPVEDTVEGVVLIVILIHPATVAGPIMEVQISQTLLLKLVAMARL